MGAEQSSQNDVAGRLNMTGVGNAKGDNMEVCQNKFDMTNAADKIGDCVPAEGTIMSGKPKERGNTVVEGLIAVNAGYVAGKGSMMTLQRVYDVKQRY